MNSIEGPIFQPFFRAHGPWFLCKDVGCVINGCWNGQPIKGGIGGIFHPPEGKDYKWYISGIFPANWGMDYATDPNF